MGDLAAVPIPTRGVIATTNAFRNRTILFGDSTVADQSVAGSNTSTVPTGAGSFVVSGGVATVKPTASIGAKTGDYVILYNFGDRTWALDPMNNTINKVTAFTVAPYSFSFATTAPAGDYSAGYNATAWGCTNQSGSADFGTFQWLRNFNSQRWNQIGNYGQNGTLTTDHLAMLPKALAGPAFDEVVLSSGVNDIVTAATNTTAAQVGAIQAFQNLTGEGLANPSLGIVPRLLAYGARILWLMPPVPDAAYTGVQYRTIAILNLRRALKEFAFRYPNVIRVIDVSADMINGALTTGGVVTGYAPSGDLHPTTTGAIGIAKAEASNIAGWYPQLDLQPVSVLEDAATYSQPGALGPNIITHGMFDGTTGTLGGGTVTGTLATGWTGQGSAGTVTGTGGSARRNTGGNSANWGFCEDIVLAASSNWTIQSANFVSQLVANTRYRIGFTVTAVGAQAGLQQLFGNFVGGGGNWAGNVAFNNYFSTFNNGYPLADGDSIEVYSDPIYWPAGMTATIVALNITAATSAAGAAHVQISNAYVRPYIDDPYGP